MSAEVIRIVGARQNNLKDLSLDLPLHELIVITGVSGSGKSSLAFDTLYAEGQRRYVESFSAYARQFLERMDKPQVERVEGIPPAIAIDQSNPIKNSRSTVGTMTELTDHIRLLFAKIGQLHCQQCGRPVQRSHAGSIVTSLLQHAAGQALAALLALQPEAAERGVLWLHSHPTQRSRRHCPGAVLSCARGPLQGVPRVSHVAGPRLGRYHGDAPPP